MDAAIIFSDILVVPQVGGCSQPHPEASSFILTHLLPLRPWA